LQFISNPQLTLCSHLNTSLAEEKPCDPDDHNSPDRSLARRAVNTGSVSSCGTEGLTACHSRRQNVSTICHLVADRIPVLNFNNSGILSALPLENQSNGWRHADCNDQLGIIGSQVITNVSVSLTLGDRNRSARHDDLLKTSRTKETRENLASIRLFTKKYLTRHAMDGSSFNFQWPAVPNGTCSQPPVAELAQVTAHTLSLRRLQNICN
jgi:hypothetical protein